MSCLVDLQNVVNNPSKLNYLALLLEECMLALLLEEYAGSDEGQPMQLVDLVDVEQRQPIYIKCVLRVM
jgi:hypothetical protein